MALLENSERDQKIKEDLLKYTPFCKINIIDKEEHNIKNHPFFYSPGDLNYDEVKPDFITPTILNELTAKFNFDDAYFRAFFILLPSNAEVVYKESFTFQSLREILNNRSHDFLLDIGVQYSGMGYVFVLTYDTRDNKFFIRLDGGSNDYARSDNYDKMKDLEYNDEKLLSIKINTFEEVLDNLDKIIDSDFNFI